MNAKVNQNEKSIDLLKSIGIKAIDSEFNKFQKVTFGDHPIRVAPMTEFAPHEIRIDIIGDRYCVFFDSAVENKVFKKDEFSILEDGNRNIIGFCVPKGLKTKDIKDKLDKNIKSLPDKSFKEVVFRDLQSRRSNIIRKMINVINKATPSLD